MFLCIKIFLENALRILFMFQNECYTPALPDGKYLCILLCGICLDGTFMYISYIRKWYYHHVSSYFSILINFLAPLLQYRVFINGFWVEVGREKKILFCVQPTRFSSMCAVTIVKPAKQAVIPRQQFLAFNNKMYRLWQGFNTHIHTDISSYFFLSVLT